MPIPVEVLLPRRWRIFPRTYRRALPSSFKEVEEARRLPLWKALNSLPGAAGRLAAIRYLLDLPKSVFREFKDEHALALLEAMPWLDVQPSPTPYIKTFRYKGETYHFPNTHGLNFVAIEYPIADEAFIKWAETGNEQSALLLCGALLREENPDQAEAILRGDKRVKLLSKNQAQARAEHFKELPEEIRTAALLYFAGVKQYVAGTYGKILFEQAEGEDKGGSTTPSLGWWSIYFSLATDGPFGNLQAVHQTPFHDLCLYLVDRVRQQREEEMRRRLASSSFGKEE